MQWPTKLKPPWTIQLGRGGMFGAAGVWDAWKTGKILDAELAIVNTVANGLRSRIHGRMPVILRRNEYAR